MTKKNLPVLSVKNFNSTEFSASPDFYVKTFQEHRKDHPFVMKPHRHDFYLIMFFTKGSGTHTIDFNSYKIAPSQVFFMSPGEMHSWTLSDDTDGFVLLFNDAFFKMIPQNRNVNEFPFFTQQNKIQNGQLNEKQTKYFNNFFAEICKEGSGKTNRQSKILRSYLDILLLKFADIFDAKSGQKINSAATLIGRAEMLIETNYKNHFPVSVYAAELNISAVQLNTLVRTYLNKTIGELCHERLILESKRLLIYTDLTVSEICHELNFNDTSYFNKFFKKNVGKTPEQFRKLLIP